MKKIYYSLICLITLLATACKKGPYPYISLDQVKKIDSAVHPAIKNAAFIYQRNIYYVADFDKPVTQITNSGNAYKFVKMSHDYTKFAYLNTSGSISIIDNKGNLITMLTQYSKVKSFDWSPDDKTLYILNGNAMVYYGPSMNLPAFTYPNIIAGSNEEVLSASVSMQGDFAYVVHGYSYLYGDKYELVIRPANNGKQIVYGNNDDKGFMDYVNFSSNKQDLVVGYQVTGDHNADMEDNIEVFTDLKSYPDFSFGNTCTPVYNSTLKYVVAGFLQNNVIAPTAFYLGPVDESGYHPNVAQNKFLNNFSLSSGSLPTDWK